MKSNLTCIERGIKPRCIHCKWGPSQSPSFRNFCDIDILTEEIGGIPEEDIKNYLLYWVKPYKGTLRYPNDTWFRAALAKYPEYLKIYEKLLILR